ncbi:MAG: cation-binding protein [Microbacteriaceae bacterium]|nr:cation-binding protein [Microbacteriaceae bacterium]
MPTSVADQTVAELGGPLSVLVRQKNDHVTLDGLLRDLRITDGNEQQRVLRRIYRLVFPHAFAEEAVLWPVMRRVLPDGGELTLEVEREHQEVNELVERLDSMGPGSAERSPVLDRLVEVLREDVRDEEDELFPRLQERVSHSELRALGVVWEILRRTAPTRAHPIVARRPPGNVIAALPLSILDRLRDLADEVALRSPAGTGVVMDTVSSGLGAVSRRVEFLPVMRRGEDRSTRYGGESPGFPWTALALAASAIVVVAASRASSARL